METYFKTLINNLNSFKYLHNINRVKPVEVPYDMTANDMITKPTNLNVIEKVEEDLRYNNVKVFAQTYGLAKIKKFFMVSFPALLGAATIYSFAVPTHYEKQKNYTIYNVETTTLASDLGQNVEEVKGYNTLEEKKLLDHQELEYINKDTDIIKFRIYDGTKSIEAKLDIADEGSLKVSDVELGNIIDMSGFEDKEYEEMNPKYAQLFDDIVRIINDYTYISDAEKEELNRLASSEKSKIIMQIIEMKELGKETITIEASRIPLRLLLIAAVVVYLVIEWMLIDGSKIPCNRSVEVEDGCYYIGGNENFGIFFGPTKYREIFMKAERERIIKAWELAKKNISPEDQDKIFTRFEKKLIKKYEKNN